MSWPIAALQALAPCWISPFSDHQTSHDRDQSKGDAATYGTSHELADLILKWSSAPVAQQVKRCKKGANAGTAGARKQGVPSSRHA